MRMKETELKTKEEIHLHAEKQIEKQIKFIGSLRLQSGHTCFELNTETGEIAKALFHKQSAVYENPKYNKEVKKVLEPNRLKLIVNEQCVYVNALNIKNAEKHFKRMVKK